MQTRGFLLVSFFGAPLAWVLHLSASYFLVALGCTVNWSGARAAILIVTIACTAAAAGAGWLGLRHRQHDGAGVRDFMAIGGAALAGLFALGILLGGLPPLFLPLCGFRAE
jgi:hypothetical protein